MQKIKSKLIKIQSEYKFQKNDENVAQNDKLH